MSRPMPRRPPEPVSVRTVRLTTACLASLRPGFRCIASFVASIFTITILLVWQALQRRSGSQLLTRPHSPLLIVNGYSTPVFPTQAMKHRSITETCRERGLLNTVLAGTPENVGVRTVLQSSLSAHPIAMGFGFGKR